MKMIIAGGRDFDNFDALWIILCSITDHVTEIVSGGARGADAAGEKAAKDAQIPLKLFTADWSRYGKSAGYRRNAEMADYAEGLIAFWDRKSKGTKHMIDLAVSKGLAIRVYDYEGKRIHEEPK